MKPQTTLPNKNNPFYNTTTNGGYSWCIVGKPTVEGLNVLDNCVGWSCGRFNEVYSTETNYQGMKYPQLNCNAENFIERGQSIGLSYQYEPVVGGIMVWEGKGSLAGHVANVEDKYEDGGVLTSESGWNHFDFRNYTRYKGDGNWGLNSNFKYLGCIINPANPKPEPVPPTPPSPYPFAGIVKKGSPLYNEYGNKYKNGASADRPVRVEGEVNGRYKVYGSTFNPHIVYVDKQNVVKASDYPFNAIVKKGTYFYNSQGQRYKSPAKDSFKVQVQGELNGRYKVYATRLNPNIVYCNKSDIIR